MAALGERFAPLGDLLQPRRYEPERPVRELPLATYEVRVPLVLDHGYNQRNEIKLEFHFEERLPPSELVTGALGPAATPEITGALPQLPYQIGLKLMTLAAKPVGIGEATRAGAVPRQMYDLDGPSARLTAESWAALSEYTLERHQFECEQAGATVHDGEPFDGIRARLQRWGDCLDESAEPWLTLRAAQESGLQRAVHLRPWGWRARAYRLIVATEALLRGPDAWPTWERANTIVALVPNSKAKRFRPGARRAVGHRRRRSAARAARPRVDRP